MPVGSAHGVVLSHIADIAANSGYLLMQILNPVMLRTGRGRQERGLCIRTGVAGLSIEDRPATREAAV